MNKSSALYWLVGLCAVFLPWCVSAERPSDDEILSADEFRIKPDAPVLTITCDQKLDDTKKDGDVSYLRAMYVTDVKSGKHIQELEIPISERNEHGVVEMWGMAALNCGHVYSDYNFDGYKDVELSVDFFMKGTTKDLYWLYNPEQEEFVFNPELSNVISAEENPYTKQITSEDMSGGFKTRLTYNWVAPYTLRLIEEEEVSPMEVPPKECKNLRWNKRVVKKLNSQGELQEDFVAAFPEEFATCVIDN